MTLRLPPNKIAWWFFVDFLFVFCFNLYRKLPQVVAIGGTRDVRMVALGGFWVALSIPCEIWGYGLLVALGGAKKLRLVAPGGCWWH
tara:strand:- start:6631 stop:6891 length:261 start_codon:yes stop_codon:yes gene_type:complete